MAILNNRDKIQSEVSTKAYADNWEKIWGGSDIGISSIDIEEEEDDNYEEDNYGQIQTCSNYSDCVAADSVLVCTCLRDGQKQE